MAANFSSSLASVSPKRSNSGLSISKTPIKFPSFRIGTTISEFDAVSQAMWPGNSCTFGATTSARRIAAVPLTLSAIKLSTEMASHLNASRVNAANPQGLAFEPGVFWLPVFLAACLVFIPNKESVTFRIIFVASCLLLATGLLPGDGFLVIFYVLGVMLFLAMGIGIFVDVTNHLQRPPQAGSLTAR